MIFFPKEHYYSLEHLAIKGKRVLIRVDFNLPCTQEGEILDTKRIVASLPTIHKVLALGGSVVLLSHFGRPDGIPNNLLSLQKCIPILSSLLQKPISFFNDCVGPAIEEGLSSLPIGSISLLENVRFHREETKATVDFAQALSRMGDIYILDAFSVIHRNHTSVSLLPYYFKEKAIGYSLQEELRSIGALFRVNKKPFFAIIGGTKIKDKAASIIGLLPYTTGMLLGSSFSALFAQDISRLTEEEQTLVQNIRYEADIKKTFLACATDGYSEEAGKPIYIDSLVDTTYPILDIGDKTIARFQSLIQSAETLLWAGPPGKYEASSFAKGTQALAEAVKETTKRGAYSLIGGGDTAASLKKFGYQEDQFSYVSTGGSALLAYIALQGGLPGLRGFI